MSTDYILFVISAVCFALSAANVPAGVNLIGLGLFTWVLTFLV